MERIIKSEGIEKDEFIIITRLMNAIVMEELRIQAGERYLQTATEDEINSDEIHLQISHNKRIKTELLEMYDKMCEILLNGRGEMVQDE